MIIASLSPASVFRLTKLPISFSVCKCVLCMQKRDQQSLRTATSKDLEIGQSPVKVKQFKSH